MQKKILIVDDDKSLHEFFEVLLRQVSLTCAFSFELKFCEFQQASHVIRKKKFDLVFLDSDAPGGEEWSSFIKEVKALYPSAVVVLCSGVDRAKAALQAVERGAYTYMVKPFSATEVKASLIKIFSALPPLPGGDSPVGISAENSKTPGTGAPGFFSPVVDVPEVLSPVMKKVLKDIQQVSSSSASVLITGESGTGKEIVARLLHQRSQVKNNIFVPVNCGAIPEGLMESEMFGHRKGAFTGAVVDKVGVFELACGGTLFLDEIAELPLSLQPKLLRALQEKTIRPVGDTADRKVHVRLICATNKNLTDQIDQGLFRQDLLYRINVVHVHLPPLRERKEDILNLVEHFVQKHSRKTPPPKWPLEVRKAFLEYHYPGNIRELENLIERLLVLNNNVSPCDVRALFKTAEPALQTGGQGEGVHSQQPLSLGNVPSFSEKGMDLEKEVSCLEKNLMVQALKQTGGLRGPAAKLLGLSERAFAYRLKKYKLQDKSFSSSLSQVS